MAPTKGTSPAVLLFPSLVADTARRATRPVAVPMADSGSHGREDRSAGEPSAGDSPGNCSMRFRKTPRFLLLTTLYVAFINLAYVASLLLRFEGDVPAWYWAGYFRIGPLFTVLSLVGYLVSGLFHGLWRYASTVTLFQVLKGVTLSALSLVGIMFFAPEDIFPRSLIVMIWVWQLLFVGGTRFAWRLSRDRVIGPAPGKATRTLVVGADNTGVHLIHEMRRHSGAEALTP